MEEPTAENLRKLGAAVAAWREHKRMTQAALGLAIGRTSRQIGVIERGEKRVGRKSYERLEDVFPWPRGTWVGILEGRLDAPEVPRRVVAESGTDGGSGQSEPPDAEKGWGDMEKSEVATELERAAAQFDEGVSILRAIAERLRPAEGQK